MILQIVYIIILLYGLIGYYTNALINTKKIYFPSLKYTKYYNRLLYNLFAISEYPQ